MANTLSRWLSIISSSSWNPIRVKTVNDRVCIRKYISWRISSHCDLHMHCELIQFNTLKSGGTSENSLKNINKNKSKKSLNKISLSKWSENTLFGNGNFPKEEACPSERILSALLRWRMLLAATCCGRMPSILSVPITVWDFSNIFLPQIGSEAVDSIHWIFEVLNESMLNKHAGWTCWMNISNELAERTCRMKMLNGQCSLNMLSKHLDGETANWNFWISTLESVDQKAISRHGTSGHSVRSVLIRRWFAADRTSQSINWVNKILCAFAEVDDKQRNWW